MKIRSIKINNFTSILSQDIPEFKDINMVYGYNNSGKSNFLKLFQLIFKAKQNNEVVQYQGDSGHETKNIGNQRNIFWEGIIENCPFIFKNDNTNTPIEFDVKVELQLNEIILPPNSHLAIKKLFFLQNDTVNLKIHGKIVSLGNDLAEIKIHELNLTNQIIFSERSSQKVYFECFNNNNTWAKNHKLRNQSEISVLTKSTYEIVSSLLSPLTDCVEFLDCDRYFVKETLKNTEKVLNSKNFNNWLFNLYLSNESFKEFNDLKDFVKEFNPSQNEQDKKEANKINSPLDNMDFSFSKDNEIITIMLQKNSNSLRLPLSSYGTGIQQIFYILSKIYTSKANIFLIEELELNLSPKYQKEILISLNKLIKNNRINQIFFTTHSKFLSLKSSITIGVYEVSIDKNGDSIIKRVKSPNKNFFKDSVNNLL